MTIITPGILNNGQISTASIADDQVTQAKLSHDIDVSHFINDAGYKSDLSTFTTDNLAEGSTNLYYTDTRVQTWFGTVGLGLINTDVVSEGSSNLYFTNARAISAIEGEATLELQEGVTVDADITIGDHLIRGNTALTATGVHIVSDSDKVKWASLQMEDYGGDFADSDDKPFNLTNPGVYGTSHGGSVASPTAMPEDKRCMNISGAARYGTGGGDTDTIGQIVIATNQAQTSTNRGGKMLFQIQANNTTDLRDILKIDAVDTSNIYLSYDPDNVFGTTVVSTGSTNGFQFDDDITVNDADLDVTGNTTLGSDSNDTVTVNAVMSIADSAGFKIGNINKATADFLDANGYVSKGGIALITDGARSNVPIFYDGSDWRYFSDSAVIAS